MSKKSFSLLFNKNKILFILLLFSCQKDECKSCYEITQSNEAQAILKCAGLPNKYPQMDISEKLIGIKCGDQIETFEKTGLQGFTSNQKCVKIEVKYTRICR